jgi:hypothetical protein
MFITKQTTLIQSNTTQVHFILTQFVTVICALHVSDGILAVFTQVVEIFSIGLQASVTYDKHVVCISNFYELS